MNLTEAIMAKYGEERSLSIDDRLRDEIRGFTGNPTGIPVNNRTAFTLPVAFACINVISQDWAMMPINVHEKGPKGRRIASEHPAQNIFRVEGNEEATAFNWKQTWMAQAVGYGNAYCEIVFDRQGEVAEIWNLCPQTTRPERSSYKKQLHYVVDGKSIPPSRILHLKGLSSDGLRGLNPVQVFKIAFALGLAVDQTMATFYGNRAEPRGVIEIPQKIDTPGYERMRDSWNAANQGIHNSSKVAILEQGAKFVAIGMPPADAQYLATRIANALTICQIYRVPPQMVGLLEKANYNSLEQQAKAYVDNTLGPWNVNAEQELNRKLFTPDERKRFYCKTNFNALLRGDSSARANFYQKLFQVGALSPNKISELEDWEPVGPEGDETYAPINFAPLKIVAKGPSKNAASPK